MSEILERAYLVDSHCHLADPAFAADLASVVDRAVSAGVRRIIAIGNGRSPQEIGATVALSERFPCVWVAIGMHPHEVGNSVGRWGEGWEDLWRNERVVAVGETGLDFHYRNSPQSVQEEAFRFFLATARRLSLPVVVHCREAFSRLFEILREENAGEVGGVLHCFGGGWEEAKRAFDLDFDISISGIVTFKNAVQLRDIVRRAPLERMLLETDAPYLAPVPHRGRRNEPAWVLTTARMVAETRGISLAEVARSTSAAAERRFRLPPLAL